MFLLFLTKHGLFQSSNYTRQELPASASTYKHTRPHGTGITCSATQLLQISHKEVTLDVMSILTITNQFLLAQAGLKNIQSLRLFAALSNISKGTHLCIYIEQHHVISSWYHEVHSSVVSMNQFVLGAVEDGVVHRQHGRDGQNLLRALITEGQTNELCLKHHNNNSRWMRSTLQHLHIIVSLPFWLTVQKPESFYSAWGPQEVQPSFGRATVQEEQNEVKTLDERAKYWHIFP